MKSFTEFFNDNYMTYESIIYTDKTLFSHIFTEDAMPSEAERAAIEQDLANKKDQNDEETIELIRKYQADPNSQEGIDARNEVVEKYLNYVHAMAWHLEKLGKIPGNVHEDSFQNGVLGLMDAIDKFEPDKGYPFLAFAKKNIYYHISNPYNIHRQKSVTGDILPQGTMSTDATVSGDRGEWADKDTTLADSLADNRSNEDSPLALSDDEIEKAKFKEYLKRLPEKDLTAIKLFLFDGKTYEEIGNVLHMSKAATQWYVDKALAKIREFAKEDGFEQGEMPKTSSLRGSAQEL